MIIAISGKIGAGKNEVGKIIQYLTYDKENLGDSKLTYKEFKDLKFDESALNWKQKAFAGKLKQIVALLTGCTVEDLESQEFKNKQLPSEWDYVNKWLIGNSDILGNYPKSIETFENDEIFKLNPTRFIHHYTYRDLLQKIGTNAMRERIHENVWVNSLMADYKEFFANKGIGSFHDPISYSKSLGYPNWIITDMRFPNELNAVEDRGGITIRVERKKLVTSEIENSLGNSLGKVTWIPIPGVDTVAEHPSETALDDVPFKYRIQNDGTIEELVEKVREILIKEKVI